MVGQDLPIYKSDDLGTTWQKLADVAAPAYMSSDPQYAKYTSNWTNAYLYTLPQAVGSLPAGTALLASIVSGDDPWYNEHKAANPSWTPSGDGDRRDIALALYSTNDQGVTWSLVNLIATAGWQGGSAGAAGVNISNANTSRQVDPLWEPFLMAHQGQLVAYYSDENDYIGYNSTTGVPTIDPNNGTATDSIGQILVHKTWAGPGTAWSQPVLDVAGYTQNMGNGKTQIGGGRPGMTTVAPTTDGKWLLTFEYWGGGANVRYKIANDPLRFFEAGDFDGDVISLLPFAAGQQALSTGGSPVLTTMSDGRIVYNAAGSGSVWVNESGLSTGQWKQYQTTMPSGYSRNLQYVEGSGRVLILQAGWSGGSIGPVKFGEVDLGSSDGTYYTLVNRLTGQVLSPELTKTQDANLTGNVADLILRNSDAGSALQRWHVQQKGSSVSLLNKSGGRALAIWTGNATVGQRVAQWADDSATDKLWNLVTTNNGYVKIQSVKNTSLYLSATAANGVVDLRALVNPSPTAAADDSQEWLLVADPATTGVPFSLRGTHSARCLDVPNGTLGVQVQVWDCVGNQNQLITATTAGELRIGGSCLAAANNGTTPGTAVILWGCNGTQSQKWTFRVDGTIVNRSNGLVLDVNNWGTANGSAVQLWTGLGNNTQKWSRI